MTELTPEHVQALMQDHNFREEVQKHMGQSQSDEMAPDTAIALQLEILRQESKEDTDKLLSRDIFLANLTEKDKNRVNRYLDLALRFSKLGLDKSAQFFYTRALLISGVSRGYQGFQQNKFIERRETRESQMEGLKPTQRNWLGFKKQ